MSFLPAALGALVDELNTSETIINMSVALYMLSMSIFPISWSAFSEEFGRRSMYLVSFTLFIVFIVFSILCAVSTNAPMPITFRLLAGGASGSVQVIGAGTIADIWESNKRGRAMSLFYLGPMLGPLLGPVLGGVLTQHLVLIAAIASCSVYILNIAIESGFADSPYNFNQTTVGLAYMSTGLGYILSSMVGGRWMDSIMSKEARKAERYDSHGKLISLPEDHMKENAWVANSLYPLSLLWFGWTMYYGVQFMVPISALFVFGFSSMLHFNLGTTMLTEFVRKRSSAGVAVNNFVRNILSCVGTIVAAPWMKGVGGGYMMTTLCIICLLLSSLGIWLITRNARRWRGTLDKALKEMD
uniref:Major facilitator superfamily transporter n=1 Tax=Gibberella subglutinans TaxID=42677 RepID=A0A0Y0KC45_GIBSU|nr:major facilitator superfamily transporter [Fusarium subglutinans]